MRAKLLVSGDMRRIAARGRGGFGGRVLQERGLKLNAGIIVDASLVVAPSSSNSAEHLRDPETRHVKKGNQWHFEMKVRIDADSKTGLVHRAVAISASKKPTLVAKCCSVRTVFSSTILFLIMVH